MKTTNEGSIPIAPVFTYRGTLLSIALLIFSSPLMAAVEDWPSAKFFVKKDIILEESMSFASASALSCLTHVNISLNQEGYAVVTPAMLVTAPDYPLDQYTVDIMGPQTDTVFCYNIGQNVIAKVHELPTGNICWSTLIVEDKLKPLLICTPDTLPCNTDIQEIDFLEFLNVVEDNCDPDPDVWYFYTVTFFTCDPSGMAGCIDVTYTATDQYGNSSTCQKKIWLSKFSLDDVVFPADTTISCENPNYEPSVTGEPMVGGKPVTHLCEMLAWKTDNVIPLCDGEKKIIRMWSVMDWCTGETITAIQKILIIDTVPPVLTCPPNITLNTSPMLCTATHTFPTPTATDACSQAPIVFKFTVSGAPGMFSPGQQVMLGLGMHFVTVFATDDCGNTAMCQYTVTVVDNEPPVVVCNPFNVYLGADGMAFVFHDHPAFMAMDNCGIDSTAIRRMSDNCDTPENLVYGESVKFCCADIGTSVTVLFKATDLSGNMNTCMVQVTVIDTIPPVAICRDVCVFIGPDGTAVLSPDSVNNGSTDNCAIVDLSLDNTDFTCDDLGDHTVILTVTDQSGNTATCSAIVTVKDTVPPTATCQDITVTLEEMGMIVITPDMIDNGSFDNCLLDSMYLTKDTFTCMDIGDAMTMLVVVDGSGLHDTCVAIVTVLEMPPVAICMDVTVYLDENGMVMITPDDVDEVFSDCSMPDRELDISEFDCDNIGDNIVTMTATDDSGNTATCTAVVTVLDTIAPVCLTMDITVFLDADGTVTIDSNAVDAGSTDNCEIVEISVDQVHFTCEDTGDPVVVIQTVTDASGNTSTCTALVTVVDEEAPVCLTMDITVQLDANGMASIPHDAVDDGSSDNCGIDDITLDQTEFTCDDVGEVIVTQTVTDIYGNSATCTAIVTVEDNVAPECLTQDITVYLDADGMATIAGDAVDNGSNDVCGIDEITVDPSSFSCDDVGMVVVTQTVTDVNGNTSTCTAIVTVVDTTGPLCVTVDITVTLDENGMVTIANDAVDGGSSDNCGPVTITVTPNMFTCEEVGPNIVTQIVTDGSGNIATCTAIVTVVDEAPPICLTQDITVYLDEDGNAMIDDDAVDDGSFDACTDVTITVTPNTFTCDDIETVVVTQTVTDLSGNSATCTAIVTVLDTIAPVCLTMDITVTLNGNGMATIPPNAVDDGSHDACGIQSITVTPSTFDCEDVGVVVVTQTVTDVNGNTSTCTANVTVEDPGMLVAICQNLTVFLDANGMVTVDAMQVDNGSGGGCTAGELTFELMPSMFTCEDIGANIVTLTVTDEEDNTATCTAIITVVDNLPPALICPPNVTIDCDDPIDINNLSPYGTPTATDNCPPVTVMESVLDERNDCGQGVITRTFLATDPSGNTAQCIQTITVGDADPFGESNITWPPEVVNLPECGDPDPGPGNEPVINGTDCAIISVSFSDDITPCVVIMRTWTVIDSCQLQPGTNDGIFTFTQMIFFNDDTGPIFAPLADITVVADTTTCTGFASLIASATDCGQPTSITNDYNAGGADASDDYPIGTTPVTFTSVDSCGNVSMLMVNVTVIDPSPTTFECHKIIVYIPEELEYTVHAREFVTVNAGTCSEPDDFFYSYSGMDPFDSLQTFNCQHVGTVTPVDIFIYDMTEMLIFDCRGDFDFRDSLDLCHQGLTISGAIHTANHAVLANVPVTISDPDMPMSYTNASGRYVHGGLEEGGSYSIAPYWDENPRQGVNVLDLIAMQKHLLGIQRIESPYRLIAADVDNSGNVSALDLYELRRLILGTIPHFTRNTSWRFVDASYEFPDPYNPWMQPFPGEMHFDLISGHMARKDFIGVKIGDVNETAFNNLSSDGGQGIDTRSEMALILNIPDVRARPGSRVEVPVSVRNYRSLLGYQFALGFDPATLRFEDILFPAGSILDKDWFGLEQVDEGYVKTLWHDAHAHSIDDGTVLFTLVFSSMAAVRLADELIVAEGELMAEAYSQDLEGQGVVPARLEVQDIKPEGAFVVFQNQPNPFIGGTLIPVHLGDPAQLVLEVFASDGRMVHRQEEQVPAGYFEFIVLSQDLGSGGIYTYTISTEHFRATRKMVLLQH